jgi:hypothetical protein
MIEFSVANSINVIIDLNSMNRGCVSFLKLIYKDFLPPVVGAKKTIRLSMGEKSFGDEGLIKLGGDAFYSDGFLGLKAGHQFKKVENFIDVIVPARVKRGRVPFIRPTPGRHISDEILEPLMVSLLQELGIRCYHASSIVGESGVATINIAWRSTGKTDAILPYVFSGRVLSDDLSFVDDEAGVLYAYPRPLRLYSYNIHRLDVSRAERFRLRLKSKLTPAWQPVEYIALKPTVHAVSKYNKVYLNGVFASCDSVGVVDESVFSNITDFEFSHFSGTKAMLKLASILN